MVTLRLVGHHLLTPKLKRPSPNETSSEMHNIISKPRVIAIAAITVSIVATAAPSATAHQVDGGPYAGTYPHQTEDWFSAWLDLMQEVGG